MRLSEYPFDIVCLACEKSERTGTYRKSRLIKRYGLDIQSPGLRLEIAADCQRSKDLQSAGMETCSVIYPDLRR